MQQFMNYINKSKQQSQKEDDVDDNDNEVNNIIDQLPSTTTTLITSSNDEPTKIVQTDLRLSTSPLSESSSPSSSLSSSCSPICSNELVINEDNYSLNSYDNKIYWSTSNWTKPDEKTT